MPECLKGRKVMCLSIRTIVELVLPKRMRSNWIPEKGDFSLVNEVQRSEAWMQQSRKDEMVY